MSDAARDTLAGKQADRMQRRKAGRGQLSLREIRMQCGLTQQELADLCGMHRNSIRKIETGVTREITRPHAEALSAALNIGISELGLHVRDTTIKAPSIRFRQLTPEQRQIVNELLSLPPEQYARLRTAIERLRERAPKRAKRRENPR